MKPPPFSYYAPDSVEALLRLLQERSSETCVLAGGQSLVPQLNQRLVRPARVIDINNIPGLATISVEGDRLVVGANVRLSEAEHSARVRAYAPLISVTLPWVANPQIRNRGTVVGNLVQAARGSEMPAVACALEAEFRLESPRGSARICSAENFYLPSGGTARSSAEFVSQVSFRIQSPDVRVAFLEAQRRSAHYALLGVAVSFALRESVIAQPRVVLCGVAPGPCRLHSVEAQLAGNPLDEAHVEKAIATIANSIEATLYDDLHGTRAYRLSVAPYLVRTALYTAAQRHGRQ